MLLITTKNHKFTLTLPLPSLQNETTNQHFSRELLMMGIVVPEHVEPIRSTIK